MPFGLANVPALFQRLMQRVLGDLNENQKFLSVYLDDVLTFEDDKVHLQEVLKSQQEVGLKLNPMKCQFVCTHVQCLGHIIIIPLPLRATSTILKQ